MAEPLDSKFLDDPEFQSLLVGCLESLERGDTIDRDALVRDFPKYGEEIGQFLDNREMLEQVAADMDGVQPSRVAIAAYANTMDSGSSPKDATFGPTVRYIGKYEILEEIARGGMGVVFKARQIDLNRIVALKMILAGQFTGKEDVQRFYTEAEAAAQLDHPGIVPIFEIGEHRGQHYFSMGYVEGESLAHKVADGPLPPREAAELVEKICDAMAYAHERGVIHRDLKPANILIDKNGQPKVTDFGLAKKTEADSNLTGTGQILGTPAYMPPEQASGKADVGPLADVYSLGAILYCLLTGRPPFQAASPMDTLLQVLDQEPVAPRQLNPQVPRDLETIAIKCLSKKPTGRYEFTSQLAAELQRYLKGEPILARPLNSIERALRWAKRHPSLSGLLVTTSAVILALVGLSVGLVYQRDLEAANRGLELANSDLEGARTKLQSTNRQLAKSLEETDAARENLAKAYDEIEELLYYRRVALALSRWQDGEVSASNKLLEDCDETRRSWEWHYVNRLCHSDLLTIGRFKGSVTTLAFRPDGESIFTGGYNTPMKFWDADNGREMRSVGVDEVGTTSRCAALSPDGTRVASSSSELLKIFDAESGEKVLEFDGHTRDVTCVAFSPDGKRIASGSNSEHKLMIWDARSGDLLHAIPSAIVELAFSPDGERIISGSGTHMRTYNAATGQELREIYLDGAFLSSNIVFSANGKRIIVACGEPTGSGFIKFLDVESGTVVREIACPTPAGCIDLSPDGQKIVATFGATLEVFNNRGESTRLIKGHTGVITNVVFSPDGKRIASSDDRTVRFWNADEDVEQESLCLRGHRKVVTSVAFSPDGQKLVSGSLDTTVLVWDLDTRRTTAVLGGHTRSVGAVAFGPNGDRIASGSADSTVKVWNAQTGEETFTFRKHEGSINSVAFSPDGKRIASASDDNTVRIWEVESGRETLTIDHPTRVAHVAFSPNGKLVSSALGSGLKVNDSLSGDQVHEFQTRIGFPYSMFSGNGTRITGSLFGVLVEWDLGTGKLSSQLEVRMGGTRRFALSPDGKRVVTLDGGLLRLSSTNSIGGQLGAYGIDRSVESLTLKGHSGEITDVNFSADGNRIASASRDNTIRIWDARPVSNADGRDDGRISRDRSVP